MSKLISSISASKDTSTFVEKAFRAKKIDLDEFLKIYSKEAEEEFRAKALLKRCISTAKAK